MALPSLFVEIGAKIGEFEAAMRTAEREITNFNKQHDEAMTGFQAGTKKAAAAAGIVASSMIGLGAVCVKMAGDFQSSQTRLVTTAGESVSNIKMVSNGILDMAGQVGMSAQELSKGMYTVESAGYHGADALKILKASAQGAKEENADLGTVSNAVTSILRDFGTKAGDAATVTSKLVAAVSVGKTNFQDLSGAMNAVMPLASAAGLSFSEVAADLASMTAHGESAEQSAQNMADAIRHLQTPTGQMSKAMADFGIQSHDVSAQLDKRGLAGTMQYLSDTILGQMGPAGTQLKSTFNQSKLAAQDANAMFQKLPAEAKNLASAYQGGSLSVGAFRQQLKALPADQAVLLSQWKSQEDASHGFSNALKTGGDSAKSYASAMQKVTGDSSSLNVALMLTGENTKFVNQNIKTVAGTTKEANGDVRDFKDTQANLNFQVAAVRAALGALAIKIGTDLLPTVTSIVKHMTSWLNVMERHPKIVEAIAIAVGVLAAAVLIFSAAMAVMEAVTSPVTLIIMAIIAVIALLVLGIYELHKHWSAIWSSIRNIAVEFGRGIADAFVGLWRAIEHATEDGWHAVTGWFSSAGHSISSAWGSTWRAIAQFCSSAWRTITGDVSNAARSIISALSSLGTGMWNSLVGAINSVLSGLASIGSWFYNIGVNIVQGIINGVANSASALYDTVKNMASNALGGIKSMLGIHSPSRVFADEVGRWIPAGVAQGIKDHQHLATDAVGDLSGAMIGVGAPAMGVATGAGGRGGVLQVQVPITTNIDGQKLATALQTIALKYQMRNGRPMFSAS